MFWLYALLRVLWGCFSWKIQQIDKKILFYAFCTEQILSGKIMVRENCSRNEVKDVKNVEFRLFVCVIRFKTYFYNNIYFNCIFKYKFFGTQQLIQI